MVKICLGLVPKDEPWGGGNQFAQSFVKYFEDRGYRVVHTLDSDVDVAVMVDPRVGDGRLFSHEELAKAKKHSNGRLRVIHRVNECDARKGSNSMDSLLAKANKCADHTVFISEWLREYFLSQWSVDNKKTSVIRNGADENIFNPDGYTSWDGQGPLKMVTHHWSDNRMKGADIYDLLDECLSAPTFRELFAFTYIGRQPKGSMWRNVKVMSPLHGKKLASMIRENHVYLTASRFEPCGMHHIEGALCGLPLLYHEEGGGIVECCSSFGIAFNNDTLVMALRAMRERYAELRMKLEASYPLKSGLMLEKWEEIINKINKGHVSVISVVSGESGPPTIESCENIKVAIPLHGKMSTRTFHTSNVKAAFTSSKLAIRYLLSPRYYSTLPAEDRCGYGELRSNLVDAFIAETPMLYRCMMMRYFCTNTESVDLRLRENLENALYENETVGSVWRYAAFYDLIRKVPGLGALVSAFETRFYRTKAHGDVLSEVDCLLAPGLGNWGFFHECMVAREAQSLGKPSFAVITNYDNIVNKGYRGYMPTAVAVWSTLMADEAMRIQGIPAKRIEITGPVQYDLFSRPPRQSREKFLLSKGLDPRKKTIFFASGVNPTRIFEFCNLFFHSAYASLFDNCNLAIRLYPDPRVLAAPEWVLLKKEMNNRKCVYVSDPLPFEADGLHSAVGALDLWGDEDMSELHGLLTHSDVMINFYSTISLEAAICDLPTIHIGYDEYVYGRQFKQRVSFLQSMTHNKRKARLQAAKVVMSQDELLKGIENYLEERTRDAEARRRYAAMECGELDGNASERLAKMIRSRV